MAASAQDPAQLDVKEVVSDIRASWAQLTAPDGPFPLREEEVQHFGTTQRYRCWQEGPNSLVHPTLPSLYGDCFCRFIDKEFLVYEDERPTYGDVMKKSAALARELRSAYGIERGRCVAIAGRNHPDWVVSLLAITGFLGAVALPVNSWWMGDELRYGLEDSGAALLIADAFLLQRAPFLSDINVPAIVMRGDATGLPTGTRSLAEVVVAGLSLQPIPLQPVNKDDTAMLMYTSGTTNKPKGVVLTQRGIMSAINGYRLLNYSNAQPTAQLVYLVGSPLFHVTGSHVALLAAVCMGARLCLMYKWDAGRALKVVQDEKVVTLIGVPTMTYDIANHPDFAKYDTSSLIGVGGGGAAFAGSMIRRVNDKFKNAKAGTGYGLTETNAISVFMPGFIFPARPTSCGLPIANVEVCILDELNKKLAAGQMGEICFHGAGVMKEYWGKPDKTAEAFHIDEEGRLWFRSGDLGALDEDGFVYIMDRAKDIIIRGGENISCGDVEGAIYEHPSVAEVAAVGLPHETLGEIVAVAVVFKVGSLSPSADELRKYAEGRLAGFKVPAEIYIWPDGGLPRGATGKIQKREIREQLSARRGAPKSKM
mmetsp:Transcript_2775/g.6902  ORF Transcript_2775/g.6902 Transcript_2775/m.6902 type:complete len:594 (-) Transcript_2775:132-1913(-)